MKKLRAAVILAVSAGIILTILFLNKASREAQIEKSSYEKITVSVSPAAMQEFSENFSIIGTVNANNDITVVSETQGKVVKLYIKTGDYVKEGTVLADVDDELKQAAFLTAKTNHEKSRRDLERIEALYKEKNVSESDLEGARLAAAAAEAQFIAARRQLSDTKIKAPISGMIADKYINQGSMTAPGTPVANIIDISNLKIKVSVPEKDIFKLKTGDKVNLNTDVYPGKTFTGTVQTISSKADNGHNYPVEIIMPNNASSPLKAGMFIQAGFSSLGKRQALTVPRAAILNSIKDPQVFVVQNGTARIRNIAAGRESGNMIEVVSGLQAGEKVVTSGQSNLTDNLNVNVIEN